MLETLLTRRVNIADLSLSPVVKAEPVFDPVGFLTPQDRSNLNSLLFKYRSETLYKRDFKELVVATKVLLPEEYRQYKGDPIWWSIVEDYHQRGMRQGFLRTYLPRHQWQTNLVNLVAARMLFPDRVSELAPDQKGWGVTCEQMGNYVQSPDDFREASQTFIKSALLFPDRVSEFRDQISPKHEDYWDSINYAIGETKTPLGDANVALVQLNLILKLLYPDRVDSLRTHLISWDKFASELRSYQDPALVIKRLGEAKLLLADEIEYTEYGVITHTKDTTSAFVTEDISLPERRKF